MSPVAAGTSLILFGLTVLLRRGSIAPRWAHAIGAGIAGLVLVNSLLHLILTADLEQTTNLLLLIVGAGSLFLSTAWLAALVATTLAGWGAAVLAHPSLAAAPSSISLHFGIALLSSTVLSTLIHAARVRNLRRIQHLRSRDEERKNELEAALEYAQESERRYRDLLDSANDLVQSVAPDGSILYANRAWHETLGYSEEELDELSIFNVIHPDSQAHCRAILQRLTEKECSQRVEATFVAKDGEQIIVEGNINCRFEDGTPVATRGIFRDVTERVQTEQALQRQNRDLMARNAVARALASSMDLHERLDEALSSTMDALGFTGGLITLADEGTDRLALFSHAGLPTSLTQSLETRGLEGTLCDVVYRKGEPLDLEDLRQGGPADVEGLLRLGLQAYAGAPIVHRDQVLGTFCLFDREPRSMSEADHALLTIIGQQIGVAVENARLFNQSRKRRLYLEGLLSAAPDAIVTLDAHHRIVEWNAGAERLFGYTSDEVVGQHLDPLITTPAALEQATGFTQAVMSGERLAPVETTRYRKGGSPVDVLVAGSPILMEGDFAGAVAVYTDISELKEAQEALRQYATQLEARNEELDAFAHTVAHDLKNPLQHLVGYAELLGDDYESLPGDIRQEALATIVATADRMNNIIGELLLLSEVRRGEVATKPLDMASIVTAAQDRLAYLIEQHHAEIVTPDRWPTALGHAAWVEEVWANYLSNAIKYGGRPPRVELGATPQPDGTVRFWVRDNGQGLTPKEQVRLFTPFTRLHQVKAEGHGLGLSIVQRIMDKLGGKVGVDSKVGEGSTFFFTLRQA
jgi:PAS domain S-box-containing protein